MTVAGRRPRICVVSTTQFNISVFLTGHLAGLSRFADIHIVHGVADAAAGAFSGIPLVQHQIVIRRPIAPLVDCYSLFVLWRLFRRERFDLVWTVAPKAGLLGMLAAWLAGIELRVHVFQGAVWASRKGVSRGVLKLADRVVAGFASRLLAVSASLRDLLAVENVARSERITVPAGGSICGVDPVRFVPDEQTRAEVRHELGLPEDAFVPLFLGRLAPDKGILDLVEAWKGLAEERAGLHLLIVGPDEASMRPRIEALVARVEDRCHFVGQTDVPERFMAAADVLCLPSYREGFGLVVIEAAAAGLPAIASRVPGLVDALVGGEGGWLHEPGSVPQIREALACAMEDPALRTRMGENARRRALQSFDHENVVAAYVQILKSWMENREAPV